MCRTGAITQLLTGADIHSLYRNGFDGALVIAESALAENSVAVSRAWAVSHSKDGLFGDGVATVSVAIDQRDRNRIEVPDDDTTFRAWFPYGRGPRFAWTDMGRGWEPELFTRDQRRAASKTIAHVQSVIGKLDRQEFGQENSDLVAQAYSRVDDLLDMVYADLHGLDSTNPDPPSWLTDES
jgi:hypothetical protein